MTRMRVTTKITSKIVTMRIMTTRMMTARIMTAKMITTTKMTVKNGANALLLAIRVFISSKYS
jgi:hypothetical protein